MTYVPGPRAEWYAGWAGYRIPFVPQEPITPEEARRRRAYYIGYYDAAGRLVKFERYLDGQLDWADHYTYHDNDHLQRRQLVRRDRSSTVQEFDRSGRMIRPG